MHFEREDASHYSVKDHYAYFCIANGSGTGKTTLKNRLRDELLYPDGIKNDHCHMISLDFDNGAHCIYGYEARYLESYFWSARILYRLSLFNSLNQSYLFCLRYGVDLYVAFELIHHCFKSLNLKGVHTLLITIDEVNELYKYLGRSQFRVAIDALLGIVRNQQQQQQQQQHHGDEIKIFPIFLLSGLIVDVDSLKSLPSQIKVNLLNLSPLSKENINDIKNYHTRKFEEKHLFESLFEINKSHGVTSSYRRYSKNNR